MIEEKQKESLAMIDKIADSNISYTHEKLKDIVDILNADDKVDKMEMIKKIIT